MDDQRNLEDAPEQEDNPQASRGRTMFDVDAADQAEMAEMRRIARKRAALLGLGGGIIMSLILVACTVLLFLLGTN